MRQRSFFLFTFLFVIAGGVLAGGQEPTLKVLPWNGHRAASSLTFDDGCPSQLDVAVPELDQRHMRATFFLIANRITRKDEWRKLLAQGHEIGNDSLDHKHAAGLTVTDAESQVVGSQRVLQNEFGISVESFAYPFSEITPELKANVAKGHWLARGGGEKWVADPRERVDWLDIPSRMTKTQIPFSTYEKWMEGNFKTGGWAVWTIHSLDPSDGGAEPLSKETFVGILDHLQKKDIWVAPFKEVGAYWRAEKIFEAGESRGGPDRTWTWKLPKDFPMDISLKVEIESSKMEKADHFEIWQGRQKIVPDAKGIYPIKFEDGQLTLKLSKG